MEEAEARREAAMKERTSRNHDHLEMEDFVEDLPEGRVRRDLEWALSQKRKPFRHFKDSLLGHPETRERWFAYHDGRLREIALAWLADEVPGARGK